MTLRECYAAMNADYEDVMGRLRSERLVQKFALKFLDDGSFALLEQSVAAHDREPAFRAAHTLKGVAQNLSFTALGASSSALTEALRDDWRPEADDLWPQVAADYRTVTNALSAFKESLPEG